MRRTLAGRSIYFADRSHLHHRIQTHVGRNWKLLFTLIALQIPLSVGGVWGTLYARGESPWSDFIPLGTAFLVLVFLIATNIFGRNELKLMILAVRKLFRKIFVRRKRKSNQPNEYINLQEDDWKQLWTSILTQTADYPCFFISLDINIPAMEVDFYASKGEQAIEKGISADPRSILTLRIPLMVQEKEYCGNLFMQYDMQETDSRSAVELADRLKDESVEAVATFMQTHHKQDERRHLRR